VEILSQAPYSITVFKSVKVDIFGLPCTSAKSSKGVRFVWNPSTMRVVSAQLLIDIWQEAGTTLSVDFNGSTVWARHRPDLFYSAEAYEVAEVLGNMANGDNILSYNYHIDFGFLKPGTIRSITLIITLESLDPYIPPAPEEPPIVIPETGEIPSIAILAGIGLIGVLLITRSGNG